LDQNGPLYGPNEYRRWDVAPSVQPFASEVKWQCPELRDAAAKAAALLLEDLPACGVSPLEVLALRLQFDARARAAALKHEMVEQAVTDSLERDTEAWIRRRSRLEYEMERLENQIIRLAEEHEAAEVTLAEAVGEAGLPFPKAGIGGPSDVEQLLIAAAPGPVEMAGCHGIVPVEQRRFRRLAQHSVSAVATVICAILVGISLSTLTRLTTLAAIRDLDPEALLWVGLTGFGSVVPMAIMWVQTTTLLARQRLRPKTPPTAEGASAPHSASFMAWIFTAACLALCGAEIITEKTGLQTLFTARQNLQEGLHTLPNPGPLGWALIGCILGAATLWAKGSATWSELDEARTAAQLGAEVHAYRQTMRQEPAYAPLLVAATRVKQCASWLRQAEERRAAVQSEYASLARPEVSAADYARLRASWEAAVGEADKWYAAFEALVAAHTKTPAVSSIDQDRQ
jgi:hypothetical protein